MSRFFQANLDRKGRVVRVIWGLLCVAGGVFVGTWFNWLAGGALIAAGVFSFFEAARGWCILRACGIKTKY